MTRRARSGSRDRESSPRSSSSESDVNRAAKRARRTRSELAVAIQAGKVPKARRAFALFVADRAAAAISSSGSTARPKRTRETSRQLMQTLAQEWLHLAEADRRQWQERSAAEFAAQRTAALAHGIRVRIDRRPAAARLSCDGSNPGSTRTQALLPPGPACGSTGPVGGSCSTAPGVANSSPNPQIHFGPDAVEAELGSGTFGKVGRGTRGPPGRRVALKVFDTDMSQDLLRELSMYNLVHGSFPSGSPGPRFIVDILGHCLHGPFPWMCMQMRGRSLRDFIKEKVSFSLEEIGAIVRQLVLGLEALHGCKVVHLDLKTRNVLWDAADRHLHIIDLGMAEVFPVRKPSYAKYVTETYRPPELWASFCILKLVPAVDVWSLGCVIFEVAMGKPLFEDSPGQAVSAWCKVYKTLARGRQPAERGASKYFAVLLTKLERRWRQLVLACCAPDPQARCLKKLQLLQ